MMDINYIRGLYRLYLNEYKGIKFNRYGRSNFNISELMHSIRFIEYDFNIIGIIDTTARVIAIIEPPTAALKARLLDIAVEYCCEVKWIKG